MADINSIFSNKKDDPSLDKKIDTQTKAILTLIQRQKDLESSLDIISQKTELNSNTQSDISKKFFKDMKAMKEDIFELKSRVKKIEDFIKKMTNQMKLLSTKDEIKKLEKYIDLWNPLDFVTHETLSNHTKKSQEVLTEIIEEFLYDKKDKK